MKVNCYLCFLGANGLVRDVLSHANVMIQAFVQVPIMNRSHICHCQPVFSANHLSPTPEKVAMAIAGQKIFPTKDKKQEWTTATEVWPSPPSIRSTLQRFCLLIYLFYFCAQHQRRHRLEGKKSWTLGSKDCLFTRLVVAGNRLLQGEMIKLLGSSWQ